MMKHGILIDLTLCVGCYACEEADAERWGHPSSDIHELSSTKNTAVVDVDGVYVSKQCMHCNEPTCESVCPVGAFEKTALGPVIYHEQRCMGCRYCMQACPFDVPRYQWDSLNPEVTKCDLCYDRIREGGQPACVEVCPAEARVFGPLDDLIAEAKRRISETPDQYISHIYGVKEAGGTSVLFLAPKDFAELGLRTQLPDHPLPTLTWAILSKIPNYVFWGTTMLAGVWWITNRRKEVMEYEQALERMEQGNPSRRVNNNDHE